MRRSELCLAYAKVRHEPKAAVEYSGMPVVTGEPRAVINNRPRLLLSELDSSLTAIVVIGVGPSDGYGLLVSRLHAEYEIRDIAGS